jgi:hypothetical protein
MQELRHNSVYGVTQSRHKSSVGESIKIFAGKEVTMENIKIASDEAGVLAHLRQYILRIAIVFIIVHDPTTKRPVKISPRLFPAVLGIWIETINGSDML